MTFVSNKSLSLLRIFMKQTLSECLSNVLITRDSNFDEKSVQLVRVEFAKIQNPYLRRKPIC